MDPNRSNRRGGFPPGFPLGREDRTPNPASSFISTHAQVDRQPQGHGESISRAHSSGHYVASPAYGEGVRRNSGFDPDKTPTQASVFLSMEDQKTPTQAPPFPLSQRTSSGGGSNYDKVQEELAMMAYYAPDVKQEHFEAMTQQFLRDFVVEATPSADKTAQGGHMAPFGGSTTVRNMPATAGHELTPSLRGNLTAMRSHDLPIRSTEASMGGGLASQGGKKPVFGGNKPVFAVDMTAPGRNTTVPGLNVTAPGGNKSGFGGMEWLADDDCDMDQQAVTGAAAFARPDTTSTLGGNKSDLNKKWSAPHKGYGMNAYAVKGAAVYARPNTTSTLGGNKPDLDKKWSAPHKGYGMSTQAVTGATPFDPPYTPFTSSQANAGPYATLPFQFQTSPKLREAFKIDWDRKKLGADQNKVIPGNNKAIQGNNKAIQGNNKVTFVSDKLHKKPGPINKPASANEKRGPAPQEAIPSNEKPSSTSSKAVDILLAKARHKNMMTELEKEALTRSEVAHAHSEAAHALSQAVFAKDGATFARSQAASDDTKRMAHEAMADEASDITDACSCLSQDLKDEITVHIEHIEDIDELISRHGSNRDDHLKAAENHGDIVGGLRHVRDLHKEALKTYMLRAHEDPALTAVLEKITRADEDTTPGGDAVSRSDAGHGATTQAPTTQVPTTQAPTAQDPTAQGVSAQATIVRRNPFEGLYVPSPAEAAAQYAAQGAFQAAASQGSAMGLHVGNTTNRPTRLQQQQQQSVAGQSKEQAFASRASAHGIRLRSAEDEKDELKKA